MKGSVLDLGKKQNRRTLDKVGGVSSVIGAGSEFEGDFKGAGNYVIYGKVTGSSDVKGTIVLEEGGTWNGTIRGENIIVAGTVNGDVLASVKIELAPSAKISGNVLGPVIAIAEGAVIEGQMKMTGNSDAKRFSEQRSESN